MSQSLAFTASTGMILPLYSDFLNSSDSVTIQSTNLFARTQPLVTAAMADVDVYLDWFFVPMTKLYTPWGQLRWQTNDFLSSLVNPANSFSGWSSYPLLNVGQSLNQYNENLAQGYNRPQFASADPAGRTSSAVNYPSQFECQGKSLFRMADLLGFNPFGVIGSRGVASGRYDNPNVFPWRALSYQCIYQEYYRNDDLEIRDVSAYNWDKYYDNSSGLVSLGGQTNNPFILRYADYRRDYFTSFKPSPIISALNLLNSASGTSPSDEAGNILKQINNYLSSSEVGFANSGSQLIEVDSGASTSPGPLTGYNYTQNILPKTEYADEGIGTANLRSLFAVEKLMRITGRAAKTYDAQTLAHFGFKIPHDVKHDITHLHSSHGMLHIGEVVGTADTFNGSMGSALGEIAGKGYVSIQDRKKVKFTAPVDGAIMCCFRAIPRLRVAGAFDKQNSISSRLDLFIPEYDKLGMQPLYKYEFDFSNQTRSSVYAWQLRYEQYKRKYDRVSMVFAYPRNTPDASVNQYSSWVLSYDFATFQSTGNTALLSQQIAVKCPPTALNSIMVVPYTPIVSSMESFENSPWAEFYTDPFICDFRAQVKKVSCMSPTGEPDMISL